MAGVFICACLPSFQKPGERRLKLQSTNCIPVLLTEDVGFDDFVLQDEPAKLTLD